MTTDRLAAVRPVRRSPTVEADIARALRRQISEGSLRPGEALSYRALAAAFGVSVTPVRIAIHGLANEKLVEVASNRRVRVSPLSLDDLEEVYATRMGLEGWLARTAVERLSGEVLTAIDKKRVAVEDAATRRDDGAYLEAVWAMRAVCYRAVERPRLYEAVERLYRRAVRYNLLAVAEERGFERSLASARWFVDACRRRDGRDAERAIRESLEGTLEYFTELLERAGDERKRPETRGSS